MARISTYGQDSTLNKLDKVVGTDSATGATKNYTIDSMIGLVNSEDLVNVFDGVSYAFKSYEAGSTNPRGIINLNAGAAANSPFSGISQIYISVLDKHGNSIANYLDDTLNSFIRIVQKTNIDTYGVLEVTAVADHDGGAYKLLTVTPRVNNGNIIANEEYFVSNYSAVFDQDFSDDSVTEFSDVTNAGSGLIITSAERTSLNNFTANGLVHNDVVDNVTTTDTTVPLSANQGKILKGLIDSINTLLTSDNVDLDSLQEVVDYIEANRSTLDSLGISNISGLQAALDAKQNTEVGKGLSTEDFTAALLTKLNSIAASAEVNVQSNWNEANTGSDAFIQNKPSDLTNLTIHDVTELNDVTSAGSGAIITSPERTKLTGIEDLADVTDTANVTAAGALMDSEVTNLDDVKSFDPTDYATAAQGATADAALPKSGGAMTGPITTNSTFDGRDVATDGAKLDTVENNADVTDTTNVTASGALMDSEVSNLDQVKQFDTADYATAAQGVKADSAQQPPAEGPFVDGDKTKLDNTASAATTIELAGTANEIEVSPTGAQDLSTNRTFTVGLPDDVTIGGDLIVNETIELANAQASTPTFDNGLYYSTDDTYDTLHFRYNGHDLSIDYLTENIPTGILKGGELSTNTSTTFDVAAGDGVINILNKENSDPHPEIKKIEWAATTITHTLGNAGETDQLNTWVYVDSAGAIQQTLTIPSPSLWRNNIVLGSVIHSENVIRFVKTFPRTAYSNGNTASEFIEIFGPLRKSGHLLTVNSSNNMALDRSAGVAFALGRNYETDAEEPNLVSDSASTPVFHRYSSTSGGFTKDDGVAGAGYTDIDPTKYDNNGTLATVSGGHYSVQRLYYFPNNTGVIVAYYGKNEYASLDIAEKNYLLEDFQEAENTSSQAIYLGAIILKGNVANLNTATDAKILTGGIFRSLSATNLGGVAVDAELNDLIDVNITSVANDQVLQYNSSTGNWENQAGISGTGAANKLAIWSSGSALTQDTNLHWDTTNDRLGIGTTSPAAKLDVEGSSVFRDQLNIDPTGDPNNVLSLNARNSNDYANLIFRNSGGSANWAELKATANTLAIQTAGSERMRIDSSGRVGIGTTSPSEKLTVYTSSASAERLALFVNNQLGSSFSASAYATFGRADINRTLDIGIYGNGLNEFDGKILVNETGGSLILGTQSTERLRIDSSGVVQVRNQTPTIQLYNTDTSLSLNQTLGDIDFYQSDPSDAGVGTVAKIRAVNDSSFAGYGELAFHTGSATSIDERVRIDYQGNVGIGTTSPSEKLEVAGNVILDADNANIKIKSGVAGTKGDIQWTFNSDSTVYASAGIEYDNRNTDGFLIDSGYPITIDAAGAYTRFSRNGNEFVRIDSSGRVGINETNPSTAKLVIETGPTSGIDLYRSAVNANFEAFRFRDSSNANTEASIGWGSDQLRLNSTNNTVFTTAGSERMRIDSNGNVGIGTTSPAVSLDVDATDAIQVPAGTTAQRPTAANGMLRYSTTDNQFEGYADGAWGAIAGSGGGSGEIVKQTFSGTGSQSLFTLSNTIADIDNISVYVSGVYQYPSNYTVSGANVTFVAGSIPASGTDNVHIIHTTAVSSITEVGSVFVDQFTGNGTDTQFSPLGAAPSSENHTDVYIDGVYQQKNAYSIAGSQITFSSAPDSGAYIEVKTTGTIAPAAVNAVTTTLVSDSFTATAGQTSFTLTNGTPSAKELTMVFVQGVYQAKANYSLLTSPTRIVLTEGAEVGEEVEVLSVSGANLTTSPVTSVDGNTGAVTSAVTSVNGQTGAVTVASTMGVNVINSSTTATANNLYVFTANLTLTLPASPSAGDSIKISNRSGVATCVLARNGSNIMGSASDLTLDTASASFELIYSDATNGWVIIGQ